MNPTKLLLISVLAMLLTAPMALGQTATVTGHALNPDGTAPSNGRVCFTLQNYSPNVPKISGVAIIVQERNFCIAVSTTDGSFSTVLYANSVISPHISPEGTYWRVDFLLNGRQQSSASYLVNAVTFNLDSAAPITTVPVATPPTGDNTYWRLDGGNSPSGNLIPAANGTQALGSTGARWNLFVNNLDVSGTVNGGGFVPSSRTISTTSPLTGGGDLSANRTIGFSNQNANTVLAGPSTGAAAAPSFRALVPADYPVFVASGASHTPGAVPDPGASAGTSKFLREDATWAAPAGGGSESVLTSTNATGANLNAPAGTIYEKWIWASAHTVTRFTLYLQSMSLGCTTNATVAVFDETASANVATLTTANSTSFFDSGALSVATTAGHTFDIRISTQPSGCTTYPGIPVFAVNYQ